MSAGDVKRTPKGTWYLDVVASDDDDDRNAGPGGKTLKTSSSRRRVPIHPELINIGFLAFAGGQEKVPGSRLFPRPEARPVRQPCELRAEAFSGQLLACSDHVKAEADLLQLPS
jgi:hypothetical protein